MRSSSPGSVRARVAIAASTSEGAKSRLMRAIDAADTSALYRPIQRSTVTPLQNATCPAMFFAASFGAG